MPLVLSLRSGQDFYLDDSQVIVGKIHGVTKFDVTVAKTGKKHTITEEQATEIADDVFLSAGDNPQRGIARVAIDAPRSVKIVRGDKYRVGLEYVQ